VIAKLLASLAETPIQQVTQIIQALMVADGIEFVDRGDEDGFVTKKSLMSFGEYYNGRIKQVKEWLGMRRLLEMWLEELRNNVANMDQLRQIIRFCRYFYQVKANIL
jgi:hypothetical protein